MIGPLLAIATVALTLYVMWVFENRLVIWDASDPGHPYLVRWHLFKCRWFRVFLHRIYRPDSGRDLHNHPWPHAFALVLWGGYTETRTHSRVAFTTQTHVAGTISTIRPLLYHRIDRVLPHTWTLFLAGPRSREWGFLTPLGHVDWREYLHLPASADLGD